MINLLKQSGFAILLFSLLFSFSCDDSDPESLVDNETEENEMEDDTDGENETTIYTVSAGDYTGKWNSTTSQGDQFTNLSITARLTSVAEGEFEGFLYISDNFTSCCGSGDSDGALSFTISENSLENFVWDSIIPSCNGQFTGTGILSADDTFEITIIGNDCDGDHTGSITLSK